MRRLLAVLAALLFALPAAAQTPPAAAVQADPALTARIRQLPALLGGTGAETYDSYFAPSFKAAVPKEKWAAVTAQLLAASGPISGVEEFTIETPFSASLKVQGRDALLQVRLAVEPAAPHLVSGLLVTGLTAREASLDAVVAAFKGLHGAAGFALAKLGTGAPQMLTAYNADTAFGIGSEFKLVILAELVRATNAGERKWDDPVTLDGSVLPAGGYNLKPKGTQVSLRELATQMISISDNSATDILLHALGRAKVEAMLPVVGIADPARLRPLMSTMELFKLKGIAGLADKYLPLDEAGRRAMLDGEIDAMPAMLITPSLFRDGKPVLIDRIEFYATPADLIRVMDWLRRNTEGPKGADARAILSKNPGVPPLVAAKWKFVGYKGGSEPGVMAMTLLLQAKNGDWYAMSGSWNDPAAAVEEGRFAGLIGRAAELGAVGAER